VTVARFSRLDVTGLVVVLGMVCAACGSSGGAAAKATPHSFNAPLANAGSLADLRDRPFNTPALGAGGACPATQSHQDLHPIVQGGKGKGPGFGFGPGPAYLSGVVVLYPGGFDNEVWLIEPAYTGPVLVRGRQMNGNHVVTFQQPITFPDSGLSSPGSPPPGQPDTTVTIEGAAIPFYPELDLPAMSATDAPGYWRMFFARTHIDAAGCYAFQIDGANFSVVIVFQVPDAARPGG
jgi:hypothetical protein